MIKEKKYRIYIIFTKIHLYFIAYRNNFNFERHTDGRYYHFVAQIHDVISYTYYIRRGQFSHKVKCKVTSILQRPKKSFAVYELWHNGGLQPLRSLTRRGSSAATTHSNDINGLAQIRLCVFIPREDLISGISLRRRLRKPRSIRGDRLCLQTEEKVRERDRERERYVFNNVKRGLVLVIRV